MYAFLGELNMKSNVAFLVHPWIKKLRIFKGNNSKGFKKQLKLISRKIVNVVRCFNHVNHQRGKNYETPGINIVVINLIIL